MGTRGERQATKRRAAKAPFARAQAEDQCYTPRRFLGLVPCALAAWSWSCFSLPPALENECIRCERECPEGYRCSEGYCVPEGAEPICEPPTQIASPPLTPGQSQGTERSLIRIPDAPNSGTPVTPLFCTRAEILTGSELPVACAGTDYRAELIAKCADDASPGQRPIVWEAGSTSPEWLSLSPDGVLTGTPPAGTHTLDLSVTIDNNNSFRAQFELQALERCWLFVASDRDAAGEPTPQQIVAARLDDPERRLTIPAGAPATLSKLDTSPSGSHLAAVLTGDDGEQALRVFQVGSSEIDELPELGSTGYVAHAFSPDSRWLALVTTDASGSTELSLGRLSDGTLLGSPLPAGYVDGLTWSDAETILFLVERDTGFEGIREQVPEQVRVNEAGLADVVDLDSLFLDPNFQVFSGLFANPRGVGLLTELDRFDYFDACTGLAQGYLVSELAALSPTLHSTAQLIGGDLSLVPQGTTPNDMGGCVALPEAGGSGCGELLAWSADGSTLLCSNQSRLTVFSYRGAAATQAGIELSRVDLDPSIEYTALRVSRPRIAFSERGGFLAFVIESRGLFVVSESAYGATPASEPLLDEPLLVAEGAPLWNFAFSDDERQLLIHQGERLFHAQLTVDRLPQLDPLSTNMGAVTACQESLPDPQLWCGAPRLPGPFVHSASGRQVAFEESSGQVFLVDVEAPLQPIGLGRRVPECESCIRFQ